MANVLHVAEVDGRLVFRSARWKRYDYVRLSPSGQVLGWTGSRRNYPGDRLVACRVATADDVRAWRRQQRLEADARLPARLAKAQRRLAWTRGEHIPQQWAELGKLTLGVGPFDVVLGGFWCGFDSRRIEVTIEDLNAKASRVRDNLARAYVEAGNLDTQIASLQRQIDHVQARAGAAIGGAA